MEKVKEHEYALHLTKRQVRLLSEACNTMARLRCGQDFIMREMMEEAWERRSKKVTGKPMSKTFEGGWAAMRDDAEAIAKTIKKRFWGLDGNAIYGIYFDKVADVLYDLHQVLRHQLWLDSGDRSNMTVDADTPMHIGNEPLAIIERASK